MAQQLPPKSQTLSSIMTHQNWINTSPAATFNLAAHSPPSWASVDDFADFTSSRRNAHRRSATDFVAFLPMLVDDSPPNSSPIAAASVAAGDGFDGLDDEQLMSMFADQMGMRNSDDNNNNPSTPSDHNSNDLDGHDRRLLQKPKEEVSHDSIPVATNLSDSGNVSGDTISDPKRIKRILANRQSARRSRVRKLQYISELERSVTTLQTEVSTLSPRVAFLDHQRLVLNVDNSALKQRIAALIQDKMFKDAHQEAMKKEIERLRQVYHEQNLKGNVTNDVESIEAKPSDHNDTRPRGGEN
ncbi:basic leucine zipper 19-like isoform X2 [Impatiens glandulifera]|uniref:basic leucine zipper 19-like isoform X2 n=1 Tax=Impatiens glandulifera TaxID=253017 RepID=UPI001FB0F18D|nr:basic leucine zipper 19-like isoform X2 [Impatiens glandulifera]